MVPSKIYALQSPADVVKMQILIQECKAGCKASAVLMEYQLRLKDQHILNSKHIRKGRLNVRRGDRKTQLDSHQLIKFCIF